MPELRYNFSVFFVPSFLLSVRGSFFIALLLSVSVNIFDLKFDFILFFFTYFSLRCDLWYFMACNSALTYKCIRRIHKYKQWVCVWFWIFLYILNEHFWFFVRIISLLYVFLRWVSWLAFDCVDMFVPFCMRAYESVPSFNIWTLEADFHWGTPFFFLIFEKDVKVWKTAWLASQCTDTFS